MPGTAYDPRESSVRDRDRDRHRRRDARDRERDRSQSEDEDTEDESTADEREKEKDRERERERERDRDRVRQRRHRGSYLSRDNAPPPPQQPESPPSRRISLTERLKGTFLRRNSVNADNGPHSPTARRGSSNAAGAAAGGLSANKASPILRIREWLDTCNSQHGRHCSGDINSPSVPNTFHPQFLINAAEKRLVRAQPDDRYIALSYVWGPGVRAAGAGGLDAPAQLIKSNLDEWLIALPEHNVPQTIADAIWLARKLGLRHIWIDRMCIIQDDEAFKENHIRHMAYVFANAYLTIVAAHNDVNTGLLPLNTRRPSRPPRVGGGSSGPDHNELLLASRWNTRGWTLQELLYSRRAVFFFEEAVTWECHCDLWQGAAGSSSNGGAFGRSGAWKGKKPACTNRVSSAALGFQHAPWPDMDEYARVAADYSARRVTQVDDTLRAFSGITTALTSVFMGGFVYGMPLLFLDAALLWRPQASIRRRPLSRPPFLPSWSWMGWWFDGVRVDLTLWKAAADYVEATRAAGKHGQPARRFQAPSAFRIKPTVVWHLSDRATSVPVPNGGFRHRDLRSRRHSSSAHAAAAELPPGWSRQGAHFVHDSDEDTLFRYPVPIEELPEDEDESLPLPPPGEQAFPGPLLAFRTTSSIFDVDFAVTLVPKDAVNPPVAVGSIWGRGRRWIGEFRAHDGWLGIQSSNYDGDEKLEFIAISSTLERGGSLVFPPDRYAEHADSRGYLEVVNVLWIERILGVAYRRGIGHVLHKAWEAHAVDEVDILLG
ncbi:Heterokaryon incompatibility [Cordyceps fumosorosea ARSEF 2679]|uniref:Heterokaryon incompatibility n=1 Tax=Cordyceps fumosorosea (strain ARSEF 2679) TaxID=1081104 RepID=A0A167ZEN9_CORFA|nr:Heterokaryon incompatibility [Cordyceps fumosorosea ARSEF 2679]OAA67421.1 Heterokaryon incompatibility [Cordyceps fumosorosea ARSEF 2679]